MTCFTSLTAHRPPCFFPQVFHWALLYLEKARQSFFSQTAEAKNIADFWWIWRRFTPYPWQRLMLVTASQAQFWHKIAIYRSESPIYFTVTRFLLTELYNSSCFVSLRQFQRATQSVLGCSGKCHWSHFLIKV